MIPLAANIANSRATQNFHFIVRLHFPLAFINGQGVSVAYSKCDGVTCVHEARRGPRYYIKSGHATYHGYVIYENTENFAARSRKMRAESHIDRTWKTKAKIASLTTKITVGKCYFY